MSKIIKWAHISTSLTTEGAKEFKNGLVESIERMQNSNLEVEVQYQQSDNYCSALILGREKE
jgi:hypothetical protein